MCKDKVRVIYWENFKKYLGKEWAYKFHVEEILIIWSDIYSNAKKVYQVKFNKT